MPLILPHKHYKGFAEKKLICHLFLAQELREIISNKEMRKILTTFK